MDYGIFGYHLFALFSNIILNTASIHATMPINVPDNTQKHEIAK